MTARERLVATQSTFRLAVAIRALLLGGSTLLLLQAIAQLAGLGSGAPIVALTAGVGVAATQVWAHRQVQSLSSIALWVEEQAPSLRYALVTIADGVSTPTLDAQALGTPWWTTVHRTIWRSLLMPIAVATVAYIAFLVMPLIRFPTHGFVGPGRGGANGASVAIDVLARVHASVHPPAYSAQAARESDDPTSIEALVGSTIAITGAGDAALLTATADSQPRSVAPRTNGWSLAIIMPSRPALVRLHSQAGRDRLIVLAPVTDASPAVTLVTPARDTVLRRPGGSVVLHAQLHDDIGLRDAEFELVVSSGGGENFTFRQGVLARVRLDNRTEASLDARVSLDSLQLKPGDVLQLRAVARDGNTVNGPGIGASETRSIRIARPDEYDSLSVEAAAPADTNNQVMSQRILINLAEALVGKQRSLTRAQFVEESRRIAYEQTKLRKHVGEVVFQRMGTNPLSEEGAESVDRAGKLTPEDVVRMADSATGGNAAGVMDVEGDETPILAINKPLLEAFNAMWDAGRSLEVGEPARALPPMRIALAAIQKARAAERIYLRGRPGTNIVDVGKVRMTGKDKGVASVREARALVNPATRRRNETFERVTSLLASSPDAAADSLLVMRVDALGDAPALASALDAAAKALRNRDNTAIALTWTRVRRALGRPPLVKDEFSPWMSAP